MIAPQDLTAKIAADNLRTWLEGEVLRDHASENQRERYAAGVLPLDELANLARAVLFAPFAEAKRWSKLAAWNVRHAPAHVVTQDLVTYEARIGALLRGPEWDALKRINAMLDRANEHPWLVRSGQRFALELRTHTATCSVCKKTCGQPSALVSVVWADRPLSREYAL